MKDRNRAIAMYNHIRTFTDIDQWAINELRKVLDAYLADGCSGCDFGDREEWEMPCLMCNRNCKDYWRAKSG